MMADVMSELKLALADVGAKQKVFENATIAVTKASGDYQDSVTKVQKLRDDLNAEVNKQLAAVGISAPDVRVNQYA